MEQFFGPGDYDVEIRSIQQALQQAAGAEDAYRTRALEAQMESAAAARENALKIAQLQAKTQRYGIDVQAETEMKRLKENARQFDASHGLEIARAYTAFASTPDMMWAKSDFEEAMGRVGQGLNPSPAMSRGTQPHAKTWEDFAAIAQYNGSTVPGAQASSSSGGNSARTTESQPAAATATATSTGTATPGATAPPDPRIKAANAIVTALPPSASAGHDENDFAALESIRALYTAGLPGSLERLGPARRKIAQAGLARLGYDPNLAEDDYRRGLPHQASPLLA